MVCAFFNKSTSGVSSSLASREHCPDAKRGDRSRSAGAWIEKRGAFSLVPAAPQAVSAWSKHGSSRFFLAFSPQQVLPRLQGFLSRTLTLHRENPEWLDRWQPNFW